MSWICEVNWASEQISKPTSEIDKRNKNLSRIFSKVNETINRAGGRILQMCDTFSSLLPASVEIGRKLRLVGWDPSGESRDQKWDTHLPSEHTNEF